MAENIKSSSYMERAAATPSELDPDKVSVEALLDRINLLEAENERLASDNAALAARNASLLGEIGDLSAENKRLELESVFDPHLRELLNRRGLDEYMTHNPLDREDGIKTAAFYVDINDFKLVNDTYGHDAGDEVLRAMQRALTGRGESDRSPFRESDPKVRIGGDEFLILAKIPNDIDHQAFIDSSVDRLVRAFTAEVSGLESVGMVGISVGVAVTNETDTYTSLIKRADSSMYQNRRRSHDMIPK